MWVFIKRFDLLCDTCDRKIKNVKKSLINQSILIFSGSFFEFYKKYAQSLGAVGMSRVTRFRVTKMGHSRALCDTFTWQKIKSGKNNSPIFQVIKVVSVGSPPWQLSRLSWPVYRIWLMEQSREKAFFGLLSRFFWL